MRSSTLALTRQAVVVGASAFMFRELVGEATVCHGPSMMPTLASSGDVVLVDKLSLRWRPLAAGDVVTSYAPHKQDGVVCKRVVGVSGDLVPLVGRRGGVRVPPGHVWLEGDNPRNSTDSRFYGAVPVPLVRGRASFRIWPPHRAGRLGSRPEEPVELSGRELAKAQLWSPAAVHQAPEPRHTRGGPGGPSGEPDQEAQDAGDSERSE